MNELMIHVERIVRPIGAAQWRKLRTAHGIAGAFTGNVG